MIIQATKSNQNHVVISNYADWKMAAKALEIQIELFIHLNFTRTHPNTSFIFPPRKCLT